jgi:hypothetical protein
MPVAVPVAVRILIVAVWVAVADRGGLQLHQTPAAVPNPVL